MLLLTLLLLDGKVLPDFVSYRVGGYDMEGALADRMSEGDATCVQADRAVGIGPTCTVLEIAPNDGAIGTELATYLMVSPGLELHFEERVVVGLSDDTIRQFGSLGSLCARSDGVGFVLLLVLFEEVHESALGLCRGRLYYGMVCLAYGIGTKEVVHPA